MIISAALETTQGLEGRVVLVTGARQCGKSTLLSLMGGLDRPTAGHVYGAGLALGELSDREISDYRLQRVSTIFQTFNLIPTLTAHSTAFVNGMGGMLSAAGTLVLANER